MKKFLRFFAIGGKAVVNAAKTPIGKKVIEGVASSIPFGNLGYSIFSAVVTAEEEIGRGNGPAKMDRALGMLSMASPQIIRDFEREFGRELANEERFRAGVQKVTEGYADITSAFNMMADEGDK